MDDLLQSLRSSLDSGKPQDCENFIRLSQPIIAAAITRTLRRWRQPDRQQVDDYVQETFLRLYLDNARSLRRTRANDSGSLAAWLCAVAAAVVIDSIRSQLSQKQGSGEPLLDVDDPSLVIPANDDTFLSAEKAIRTERIDRCLEFQKKRDRSIFWLYFRQGMTAKDIAGIDVLGLNPKGVETVIIRVTRAVRACLSGTGSRNSEGV